ncbi:hypothetical protein ABTY53_01345 [Streptomyces noursei]|uniref:hypothetical protein n=1 Tax=Streptomyces noursei TaxID=1971 RepID=UPI0033312FEE
MTNAGVVDDLVSGIKAEGVVARWRAVEWTEDQGMRLARLLFGHIADGGTE